MLREEVPSDERLITSLVTISWRTVVLVATSDNDSIQGVGVGRELGLAEGATDGVIDGKSLGTEVGRLDGTEEGTSLGTELGTQLGTSLGTVPVRH
jgi:hypothetical protein